nr:glucose-1-phosphate thymidylyltransferase RfbA [Bacteriovorax sp. HI3]
MNKVTKGIILAGGSGTRLYPLTKIITKQLLNIYDKPMIFYPLSLLMLGGIREVLIITTPHDQVHFKSLLGDGSQWGIKLEYVIQEKPTGLPDAFILGEKFIGNDNVTLILGDNMFYGDIKFFKNALLSPAKAKAFAYPVSDPERYGVIEFEAKTQKVLSLEEKPKAPKSKYAIPGLYIFDNSVSEKAKKIKPSARGETEIVELLKMYMQEGELQAQVISRGVAWLDTGTPKSLLEASAYISAIEERQGLKVACLEEIALRMDFITIDNYNKIVGTLPECPYKKYLQNVASEIEGQHA